MSEKELIAKYEALGWKRLRWTDRKGNECSGWRSPDGKRCALPPAEIQEFHKRKLNGVALGRWLRSKAKSERKLALIAEKPGHHLK